MPIYMFKCRTCNHYQEELFFELLNTHQREILMNEEKNTCDNCSDVNWTAKISLFQLDSTSKTHRYGVDGYYSKALGKHVDSPAAEQKIMEKRGFVCEADLAPHFWDDKTQTMTYYPKAESHSHRQEKVDYSSFPSPLENSIGNFLSDSPVESNKTITLQTLEILAD